MAKGGLISKLGMGLLAGALAFGIVKAEGAQDLLYLENGIDKQGESVGKYDYLQMGRYNSALDGVDSYDKDYAYPVLEENKWSPKSFTSVETHDLYRDLRSPNHIGDFNFNIGVIIQDGANLVGQNQLGLKIYDTSLYDYIPQNEFWSISYNYDTNYFVSGGGPRTDKKNLRDLCPVANNLYYWNTGVNIDLPFADADANGQIIFGTGTFRKEYNDLHFDQPANGSIAASNLQTSAAITNGQKFIYNDMTDAGVSVNADSGYHLYSWEDVRTDINTGDRVTNTVYFPTTPGSYVSNFSTNLEDLVGDNRVSAVMQEDRTQTTNGIPYQWLEDNEITNFGDSVEMEHHDEDKYNALEEYVLDYDPNVSNEAFDIKEFKRFTGTNHITAGKTSSDRFYRLYSGTTLAGGLDYLETLPGNGGDLTFSTTNGNFYKVNAGTEE